MKTVQNQGMSNPNRLLNEPNSDAPSNTMHVDALNRCLCNDWDGERYFEAFYHQVLHLL